MKSKQFFIKILANKDTLDTITNQLGDEYQVDIFDSAGDFLQSMLHQSCNLMVIEANTDDYDGYYVKKKARTIQSGNNLIILSKKRDIETVSKCQREGADYLFFLPLDENEFKTALSIMYRRRTYWINLMKEVAGGQNG